MDSSDERKKSVLEPRISYGKLQRTPKNQQTSEQNVSTVASSAGKLNRVTPASNISLSNPETYTSCDDATNSSEITAYLSGAGNTSGAGDVSDLATDDVDYHNYPVDQKTKAAIEHLQSKIQRTMVMIEDEQNAKSENVNEYLRLSSDADRQQAPRIKLVFEKKNQKSTQSIAQLQRKLEDYQKRLKDVETYGISGHKQAKDVLKDVGQGLKDFFAREPVRSRDGSPSGLRDLTSNAQDGLCSSGMKYKVLRNKFGSADNISSVKLTKEGINNDRTEKSSQPNAARYHIGNRNLSDEEASSITSDSVPSGEFLFPYPLVSTEHSTMAAPSTTVTEHELRTSNADRHPETTLSSKFITVADPPLNLDLTSILLELQHNQDSRKQLQLTIDNLTNQLEAEGIYYRQALEEEHDHSERLEEQINDLSELHQHEVTNIKQELTSMQEKMEYQLDERTRDMQELLEACQTKITKMELQQQQQQLISMEGIENSNFRALITKLINVMLALLAVVLVLVSTVANLIGPFLTSRLRILSTVFLVTGVVVTWQNWLVISDVVQSLVDEVQHLIST